MSFINTGCGLAGLRSLDPGSVELVFCDLPSGETRAHFDNPIDLAEFWPAAWACLKPNGAVVLMASSLRYAATVIASEPKWYRYDVVWEKSKATGFLNAKRQPLRAHEFVLVFCRVAPPYRPQVTSGHAVASGGGRQKRGGRSGGNYGDSRPYDYGGTTDRQPRSVLRVASLEGPERRHPQQKPIPLLQWVVRTYTNPGELVVDPCAGSGSMGVAAIGDGREFVGWDFEPKPPSAVQNGLFTSGG